jgi:hypothetical protein
MSAEREAAADVPARGLVMLCAASVRVTFCTGSVSFVCVRNPGSIDEVVLRDYTDAKLQVNPRKGIRVDG